MATSVDRQLIRALKKSTSERTSSEIDSIVHYLQHSTKGYDERPSPVFLGLSNDEVRHLASQARYEWRDADELLFTSEDDIDSTAFALISGLVYVENRLAYPGTVIQGNRGGGGRFNDCIVLEPSEFLTVHFSRRTDIVHTPSSPSSSSMSAAQRRRVIASGATWQLNRQPFMHILSDPSLEESSVDNVEQQSNSTSPVETGEVSVMVGLNKNSKSNQKFPKRPPSDDASSLSSFTSSSIAPSSGLRRGSTNQQGSSLTVDDIDFAGLPESAVDSDDDLLSQTEETSTSDISDVYRECLEKNPGQRSERDLDLLVDFVQNFPAFANLTQNEKRSLCQVMTYAVVEEAGAVILSEGDDVDSWSVIINGALEHRLGDGSVRELGVGESFGVESSREKPRQHNGVLRTLVAYCQFIVVTHNDYVSVLSRAEQDKQVVREKGNVVLVMEERDFVFQHGQAHLATFPRNASAASAEASGCPQRSKRVPVVIRGTIDRLIELIVPHLPESQQQPLNSIAITHNTDPTFSEDFLMTFPLFLDTVAPICDYLIAALSDSSSPLRQKKTANVITHWVSADFGLFERISELGDFLEAVEDVLEEVGLIPQLKLLLLATHSRSRPRHVVITKPPQPTMPQSALQSNNISSLPPRPPSSSSNLLDTAGFQICGGLEHRTGIFVLQIQSDGPACRAGLRRGDQILHVNNHDFASVTYSRAAEILQATSHLALTVKYNKLGLQSVVSGLAHLPAVTQGISAVTSKSRARPPLPPSNIPTSQSLSSNEMKQQQQTNVRSASAASETNNVTNKHGTRFSRLVAKVSKKLSGGKHIPPSISVISENSMDEQSVTLPITTNLTRSRSNPDLVSGILPKKSPFPDPPDQALILYTPDQDHRYFMIRSDTTAADLIGMAVRDFGISKSDATARSDPLGNYALFEVTVHPTTQSVRTRRLLDDRSDLAERLPVCGRYYLRQISSQSCQTLVGPQEVSEISNELAKVNLLSMRPRLVALVLTLAEFEAFEQIQPLDYIDDVLALTENNRSSLLSSGGGHARVEAMTALSNRQLFWVVTEVTSETKLRRRVQLVQFFIKLAGFCLRLNNFESTFAIVAGLGYSGVVRLNSTWARVAPKYKKLLEDYRELFDPSRNMSRYRNHIARLQREGRLCPAVPLFPLVKKDLAFVHLGNSTFVNAGDSDNQSTGSLINVEKLRMLGREVRQIRQLCAERYPGKELFDQVYFGTPNDSGHRGAAMGSGWLTLGRRKGPTLPRASELTSGPKHIFAAAKMKKQIEFYLNSRLHFPPSRNTVIEAIPVTDETAKICTDERQLMILSKQCEPDAAPAASAGTPMKPSMPAPIPIAPVVPKFGTAEGQNISKMMSLCKEVKPHSEKIGKPLPLGIMAAVSSSPVPATTPAQVRSPPGQRIPRNLIYQYVLQQQMTDIHAELRRRPIGRLSSESSSIAPASIRSPSGFSTIHSSTSSGIAQF